MTEVKTNIIMITNGNIWKTKPMLSQNTFLKQKKERSIIRKDELANMSHTHTQSIKKNQDQNIFCPSRI